MTNKNIEDIAQKWTVILAEANEVVPRSEATLIRLLHEQWDAHLNIAQQLRDIEQRCLELENKAVAMESLEGDYQQLHKAKLKQSFERILLNVAHDSFVIVHDALADLDSI